MTTPNPIGDGTAVAPERMLREVQEGLSRPEKRLPSKFFYDARGSQLFEQICELPEYYVTRTELSIMQDSIDEICAALGPRVRLVEFGSGSSIKTRLLIEHLEQLASYVPIEISGDMLEIAVADLRKRFPRLLVQPKAADYTQPLSLPPAPPGVARTACYFPGSTLGNFAVDDAVAFLRNANQVCGPKGRLLIGVDLRKDLSVVLPAYNDSQGVTAEFNLNVLVHCNSELGADFDVDAFEHQAVWDEAGSRIVMQLVSKKAQRVHLGGREFAFKAGEIITTEFSHKWSEEAFAEIAGRANFAVERVWTDERRWFSVQLLRRKTD